MPESWKSRRTRWLFNWIPAYRGTGARLDYIADDWGEVRIHLALSWRTRNYVATIFGGSLFGALDPIYMVMLIKLLGPEFIVWNKAATIRYLRPGRSRLTATFRISEGLLAAIRAEAVAAGRVERAFEAELVDETGQVHAACTQTIHIRWRGAPQPGEGGR